MSNAEDYKHNMLISYMLPLLANGSMCALAVYISSLPENTKPAEALKLALVSGSLFLFFVFDFASFLKIKPSQWRGRPIMIKLIVNDVIMLLLPDKMVRVLEYAPKRVLEVVVWLVFSSVVWVFAWFCGEGIYLTYKLLRWIFFSRNHSGALTETQSLLEKDYALERGDVKDGQLSDTTSQAA